MRPATDSVLKRTPNRVSSERTSKKKKGPPAECHTVWKGDQPPDYLINFSDPTHKYNPSRVGCYSAKDISDTLTTEMIDTIGEQEYLPIESPYGPANILDDRDIVDRISEGDFRHVLIDAVYLEYDSKILGMPAYKLIAPPKSPFVANPKTFALNETVSCKPIIQRLLQMERCPMQYDVFSASNVASLYRYIAYLPNINEGFEPDYAHEIMYGKSEEITDAIRKYNIVINLVSIKTSSTTFGHANFIAYKASTREVYIYDPHGLPKIDLLQQWMFIPDGWKLVSERCPIGLQGKFKEKGPGICSLWVCLITFLWIRCPTQSIRKVEEDVSSYGRHAVERIVNNFYCYMSKKTILAGDIIVEAELGNIDRVRLLLEYGANVNDGEALINAADEGHADIVELLLAYGTNVHANEDESFIRSIENNRLDIAQLLLDYGANVHVNDNETIRYALSTEGSLDTVRFLVANGANPNVLDESGRTSLFYQASADRIRTLLAVGINPFIEDNDGKTALHYHEMNNFHENADIIREAMFERSPM
jgi:hypothetical protein